jgi:tetratricopeptide (TPR) repeat protein
VVGQRRIASRLVAVDAHAQAAVPTRAARPARLVGRAQERALLRHGWEWACHGEGRIVLLTGDAGIGKSRLVQVLVEELRGEPHFELEFHCSADHTNSPLYPVLYLLPRVIGFGRHDSEQLRLDTLEAFCLQRRLSDLEALPLLAALLSLPASSRFPLAPMSADRQKQQTLQTLLNVALSFADERPLLMVVEDLHWIDPTTMELLALALNHVPGARIFGVFTARLPFRPGWPPHSNVTPVVLTRLDRDDTERMVHEVAAGKALPADTLQHIVARTDGVPLFVEELTKAVLEAGLPEEHGPQPAAALPRHAIPATLQDSLMARLDRLEEGKALAQLAAALGREFSYSMLRAVSTLDEPALQRQLARLADAQFIHQRGAPPELTYAFKHALIQEAAYQSLLRSSRHAYHRRIADVLVGRFPSEADRHPELVARHYTEAAQPEMALSWWQRAGQQAFASASYAEAINHYTKGLEVLQLLPRSDRRDELEFALQVELGYALIPPRGWAAAEAAQAFGRAGELCRGLADAAQQFRALWGLGAFHFVRGDQHQARQIADQALAVAHGSGDEDAAIEARYLSGIVSCARGDFASARVDLEQCTRLYGQQWRQRHWLLYGQDAKASALGWLAMVLCVLGEPEAALAHAQQALQWVRHATQPFLHARALASVGFVHFFRREPQLADEPLRGAIALCSEQRFAYFGAVVSAFHGACVCALGETERGVAMLQRSLGTLRDLGSEVLFTIIRAELAAGELALGLVDQGLATTADGLRCVAANGEHWAEAELYRIRGKLLLARGLGEEAHAEASFRRALDVASQQRANAYRLRAVICLARLWQQQRRHQQGYELLCDSLRTWPGMLDTADLRQARNLVHDLRLAVQSPT